MNKPSPDQSIPGAVSNSGEPSLNGWSGTHQEGRSVNMDTFCAHGLPPQLNGGCNHNAVCWRFLTSHARAQIIGSNENSVPIEDTPSTRMIFADVMLNGRKCERSTDVEMPELESPAAPHGCSQDCVACRDLNHTVELPPNFVPRRIPVPPVVLVGRLPDNTVNNWPPFGCKGRGLPRPPCTGPICFRRREQAVGTVVSEQPLPPPNTLHCKNVQYPVDAFLVMNELRKAAGGSLCDVRLQAGLQVFPAHRVVLAASSNYFRAMFTTGMKEEKEELVKLENICPRILGKLIDFCYTSEITVGERWICKILPAAVMLQMPHVIDCCTHFLETHLDPYNAIGIAEFAHQHGCDALTRTAREFIDKNFSEVSQNEEFLQLSVCQLINLIKRDELVVHSESEVYDAVMRWIRYDEKHRRPNLEKIVYAVRCYFLPPSFLEQQLRSCDMLRSFPNCRQYLEKIVKELTEHKKCHMPKRRNPDLPMVIYVVGGYLRYSLNRLDSFCPKSQVWRGLCNMPTFRSGVSSAFVHGLLYVMGGRCTLPEGNSDSNAVDAYDPFADAWRSCPPMSVARNRGGAINLDNMLYVVGGSMQTTFHRSGERYNPLDDTWSPIADMFRMRLGLGVASLNRLLYAVGGFDGAERLSCVECYDPDTNMWKFVAPMNTQRSGAGVASMDGSIYAVGGYDGRNQLASVERYDPETDRWEFVAPMRVARSALAVVSLDRRLYAIGGYDGQEFSTAVESFDLETGEWRTETPLPEGRSGHGAAVWWGSCCYENAECVG
ncbi:kelch-like ECH-associated protein 1B isoform X2 [Paramacrobiotus metropolitanus]|uniref:kelch-like ECH-associated protein 1B isoform X2 n=1 Tax=Paramacrobiotus metropolitanus TaxID=2943436 RepID=UPI002445FA77|nr:kelch-like ECH-associated protein 1B isoform X2 [Paramacrobiotus metropolitanus]